MTTHYTASGSATLIGSWGHGKAPAKDFQLMPACLLADDGDGHYDAWGITGKMADAAQALARFYVKGERVVAYDAGLLSAINCPDDFWIELPSGDFEPNLVTYPGILAW